MVAIVSETVPSSYQTSALDRAIEQLWQAGIVVVVSAGNSGYGSARLNNPAVNPYVIAVGASDPNGTYDVKVDVVPSWSSRGSGRTPDVVAPCKSIVSLRDPDTGIDAFARVKVPKEVLPRFIAIGENTFVPLEAVIARNLHELFPGMEITAHDYFRVTRDADFTVSDEADDLVRAVEQELRQRRFGEVVRLEVGDTMEPELRQ